MDLPYYAVLNHFQNNDFCKKKQLKKAYLNDVPDHIVYLITVFFTIDVSKAVVVLNTSGGF